jgi:hypothetical protein
LEKDGGLRAGVNVDGGCMEERGGGGGEGVGSLMGCPPVRRPKEFITVSVKWCVIMEFLLFHILSVYYWTYFERLSGRMYSYRTVKSSKVRYSKVQRSKVQKPSIVLAGLNVVCKKSGLKS